MCNVPGYGPVKVIRGHWQWLVEAFYTAYSDNPLQEVVEVSVLRFSGLMLTALSV